MSKATLYLFIGFPGAGKTTVAQKIAEATGAIHLWADRERHKLFPHPTHSREESDALYDKLNASTEYLLAQHKSVVFDTNFNFYADRLKLRQIAAQRGAETVIIWVTTPLSVARDRAVCTDKNRNGYMTSMTEQQFYDIVKKLEPPKKDEKVIKIADPKIDTDALMALLSQ